VAIVGGGIQGAGVAQAASAAAMHAIGGARGVGKRHVASVEQLIHGGLRYLESGQLNLVYHRPTKRQRLAAQRAATCRSGTILYSDLSTYATASLADCAGLSLYALLTGLHPQARFRSVPRSEWVTLVLWQQDLQAVFQYWDGQTDDAALTRAVANSATQLGAHCLQHCELLSAQRQTRGDFFWQLRCE